MSDELCAVYLDDGGRILCASCGEARYPDGTFPKGATPVYESDGWKGEVNGPCDGDGCETFVGNAAEPKRRKGGRAGR